MNHVRKNNFAEVTSKLAVVFMVITSLVLPQVTEAQSFSAFASTMTSTLASNVVDQSSTIAIVPLTTSTIGISEATSTVVQDTRIAKRTMSVVSTAYSSEAAQTDATPCIPAMSRFNLCDYYEQTGLEDTIAANFLPLGTEVRIPEMYGDQIFVVRDRMNSKYNGKSRIDLWKKDRATAVQFGVHRFKIEIL